MRPPFAVEASRSRGLQLQRRLEEHRAGRILVSVFVVGLVASMVVANLPERFAAVRRVSGVTSHVIEAVGLYQVWSVFTPPRNEVLELEARITFADGRTTVWRPPRNNALVGAYRDYHWQKYTEHAALRGNADGWPRLWEPLARYVAREVQGPGRLPVRVTLITHRTPNLPLDGDGPDRGPERVDKYYTLDLPRQRPGP